jgi:hypothetical protein
VLRHNLHLSPNEIVSMNNKSVDKDIASFISVHLKDSYKLRKWENYHDRIEKELTTRANGVCVLRFLSREFY